jgi:hypothetical protein
MADALEALAELRARQAQAAVSAGLYAAAAAVREAIGAPVPPCDRPRHQRDLASLRVALGEHRFAAVWEEAHRSSVDQALIEALTTAT